MAASLVMTVRAFFLAASCHPPGLFFGSGTLKVRQQFLVLLQGNSFDRFCKDNKAGGNIRYIHYKLQSCLNKSFSSAGFCGG